MRPTHDLNRDLSTDEGSLVIESHRQIVFLFSFGTSARLSESASQDKAQVVLPKWDDLPIYR